ncbi:tropomyosin-1, isoforms 33/34-like [Amblyraja radiata]|uniref:tropomyosin-1, isoforms 33/34-like n=1 Tax=Amblyraja radiata TaxID=386614 RepID=UPI001402F623|nr:tropomyosin-1, isoforms 33/34-like [Amblyraja radiata]XP_032891721.1 tropomyosin-1, isoforms 33/34-like [Amblyraja radiata]
MSKKKKGRAEAKAKPVGMQEEVLSNTTDRIVTLQNEFDEIVTELKQLKLKIYQLRHENEFLEKEAQQTRLETQEYIQQMAKRSEKTQNQIISLSDQNQKQLDEIRNAKEKILADFESQKQDMKMTQIEKETELVQINKEIESLNEYKELREVQLNRIKELDEEVMDARAQHSQNLHNLKVNFNKEKNEYKQNAKRMVKLLEKEANKEAVTCLIHHIEAIKEEKPGPPGGAGVPDPSVSGVAGAAAGAAGAAEPAAAGEGSTAASSGPCASASTWTTSRPPSPSPTSPAPTSSPGRRSAPRLRSGNVPSGSPRWWWWWRQPRWSTCGTQTTRNPRTRSPRPARNPSRWWMRRWRRMMRKQIMMTRGWDRPTANTGSSKPNKVSNTKPQPALDTTALPLSMLFQILYLFFSLCR